MFQPEQNGGGIGGALADLRIGPARFPKEIFPIGEKRQYLKPVSSFSAEWQNKFIDSKETEVKDRELLRSVLKNPNLFERAYVVESHITDRWGSVEAAKLVAEYLSISLKQNTPQKELVLFINTTDKNAGNLEHLKYVMGGKLHPILKALISFSSEGKKIVQTVEPLGQLLAKHSQTLTIAYNKKKAQAIVYLKLNPNSGNKDEELKKANAVADGIQRLVEAKCREKPAACPSR
jgi:hypothetical protein